MSTSIAGMAPMIILALDTCLSTCSAAVRSTEAGLLARLSEAMDKGQSERIVPMIGEVLQKGGLLLDEIDRIAVTIGPGTFTGVRTGLSVARGLALATGIETCGTTSLHVIAAALGDRAHGLPIAVAVATRDQLVYLQTFAPAGTEPCDGARLVSAADAAAALGMTSHLLAGSGGALVAAAGRVLGVTHEIMNGPCEPDAAVLAALAPQLPTLSPPKPLYLREPDAKPTATIHNAPTSRNPDAAA